MKKIGWFLVAALLLIGCKTNQTINGKREGKWVFKETINDTTYYQKGKYKNGIESGVWKLYENKKLVRVEKYKGKTGYMTNYYPNGKIESQGGTQLETTETRFIWCLSGDWDYFDENGKHILTRTYLNGNKLTEKQIDN